MSVSPTSASPPPSSTSSAFPPASTDTRQSTTDYPSQPSSRTTTSRSFNTSSRRVTPPAHADESPAPLHDNLSDLDARLRRFEARLSAATAAEADFRASIQSWTNSLDAFIYRHVADDTHLSRLIHDDTQRSREVKEGYDALASMLVSHVRAPSRTRVVNALATVWAYVSIVLSLVLFAPVHALWTFASRRFAPPPQPVQPAATRRRPRSRDERRPARPIPPLLGADAAGRTRGAQPSASPPLQYLPSGASSATGMPGATESTPMSGPKPAETGGWTASEDGSEDDFVDALTESLGETKRRAGAAADERRSAARTESAGLGGRVTMPAAVTGGGGLEEVSELEARAAARRGGVGGVLGDDGGDGGVVTAVGDEDAGESERGSSAGDAADGDEDGNSERDAGRRPGWAVPSESWSDDEDEAAKEGAFPSADFFTISAEDMRLDLLRDAPGNSRAAAE